ncbi:putative transferase [Helianthus debilis subsp. tardiflorus]
MTMMKPLSIRISSLTNQKISVMKKVKVKAKICTTIITSSKYNFDPVMRSRLWWYNFDPVMRSRLGWCIEWLQANFLVLDDIMDESHTNRVGSLSAIREMEGAYRECAVKETSTLWMYIIKVYYLRTGLDRSIWTCTNP